VNRPDAGAGEHRQHAFDYHRHVDSDPVTLFYTQRLERVGHAHDLGIKRTIGQAATGRGGIVRLENQRNCIAALGQMAIDRIVAQVEFAIGEPIDADRIVGPFAALGGRCGPVQPLRLLEPEAVRILERAAVHRFILFGGTGCAVSSAIGSVNHTGLVGYILH